MAAKRKKPTKKARKRARLILLTRVILTSGIAAALLIAPYCLYLSVKIDKRFSERRWEIPSRVFSDSAVLMPGQGLRTDSFKARLKALGYREVFTKPRSKGEMKMAGSTFDIFLHDLRIPGVDRPGFPVRIRTGSGKIKSITALSSMRALSMVELEPEEVMLFYGVEHERRRLVTLEQVPENLINAVLAAEDRHFYSHYGLDPFGIARAMLINIWHGEIRQGGSTITQQLAKNYFLTSRRSFSRKLNEALIAVILDARYDKKQILEMYLNEIYLGQKGSASIHGFGEAAFFYFGKQAGDLSLSECAALAGLIKSPGHFSPFADKKACTRRRNLILQAMSDNALISKNELLAAKKAELRTAQYCPTSKKAPYFMDYLAQQLRDMYPADVLSGQGLSIYTTIDMQVQTAAEQALARGLERLEKTRPRLRRSRPEQQLQAAIIVMDPKSGAIKAMVGGRNYALSQFNRITQARRQPGSAFKPFVYLASLDTCTPATLLSNEPRVITLGGKLWRPKNYSAVPELKFTLREALARSVNLATIDLGMRTGLGTIISTARQFEFSTPLTPTPALVLGASEVIPLELARAYCAFASGGVLPEAFTLKKVVDENGTVLALRHMRAKRIISPQKAFVMNSLLKSVVSEGTATRGIAAAGITLPAAGKTGTTNDSRDAWFVGYTPDLLALVWVGFDNGASTGNTGSTAAVPIWAELIGSVPHCTAGSWFEKPQGVVSAAVCKESGQLANKGRCPHHEEFFLEFNAPSETCTLHKPGIFQKVKSFFNPF